MLNIKWIRHTTIPFETIHFQYHITDFFLSLSRHIIQFIVQFNATNENEEMKKTKQKKTKHIDKLTKSTSQYRKMSPRMCQFVE